MLQKILGYGLVGLLAAALVAGLAYILLLPAEVQAEQGPRGGQGRGTAEQGQASPRGNEIGASGGGAYGRGQERGARGGAAENGSEGLDHPMDTWAPIVGTVVSLDEDLILQTEDGEVTVNLGPTWYLDGQGFTLEPGDEVVVSGFYDTGTFEAGTLQNLATGETLTLRDETGRPLWAGRGRRGQQ